MSNGCYWLSDEQFAQLAPLMPRDTLRVPRVDDRRVIPGNGLLHGDKGYDSNAIRQRLAARGTLANIPPKANRKWKNCFSPYLCLNRNVIERMCARLKEFRRIATRYDRYANNFFAALCIAAIVSYWL